MKIVISGNCQRYPLAHEIALTLPRARIVCFALPELLEESNVNHPQIAVLIEALQGSQVWITQGQAGWAEQVLSALPQEASRPQLIRIPAIGFAAFHPDICLVADDGRGDGGDLIAPAFHSTIAAWAYRRSLPIKTAVSLFGEPAFNALGYFVAWDASVDFLKQAFSESDLAHDFDSFFYKLKRGGVFMHTFNHPRQEAMALLGELVAARMDASDRVAEARVQTEASLEHNVLAQTDWPIYPPISNRLGFAGGSYVWRVGEQTITGVEHFVKAMYESYRAQGITPANLRILNRSLSELDRALMPCVKSVS